MYVYGYTLLVDKRTPCLESETSCGLACNQRGGGGGQRVPPLRSMPSQLVSVRRNQHVHACMFGLIGKAA